MKKEVKSRLTTKRTYIRRTVSGLEFGRNRRAVLPSDLVGDSRAILGEAIEAGLSRRRHCAGEGGSGWAGENRGVD